jgi:hypothetical protein
VFLIVVLLSVALPGILAFGLWAIERWAHRWTKAVYAVVVFALTTLFMARIVHRADFLAAWVALLTTLTCGASGAWAYFHWPRVRRLVSAASPAVIGFPALLLLHSPLARHYSTGPQQDFQLNGRPPVPVVVIVLDELSGATLQNEHREIDSERFPNFAVLAGQSTWFRNATTVYPDTCQAVPAILSGMYPSSKLNPMPADRPQNLFSVFAATEQYDLAIFEPVSRLARSSNERGMPIASHPVHEAAALLNLVARVVASDLLPDEIDDSLPVIPRIWFGISNAGTVNRQLNRGVFRYPWGEDRRGQFEHFLRCLDESERPALYFFHAILPHVPWSYLPSGRKCLVESDSWELLDSQTFCGQFDGWGADELYVAHSQQRHLLQLQFTDMQLGRVLERLRETGLYEKCLLVVTADHGISFRTADARRVITETNRNDILSVPLFVKVPGQNAGAISEKNAEVVDILPTVAELVGIRLNSPVDGRSVFCPSDEERTRKSYHTALTLENPPVALSANTIETPSLSAEIRRRFGPSDDPRAIYRIGPHPELIGRAVAGDLVASAPGSLNLQLVRWETAYHPDVDELVPCYFQGKVPKSLDATQPIELAIAVNGTIQGTTRTYLLNGYRDWFSVMIEEGALRPGDNDIRFFQITANGDTLRLLPCSATVMPSVQ